MLLGIGRLRRWRMLAEAHMGVGKDTLSGLFGCSMFLV